MKVFIYYFLVWSFVSIFFQLAGNSESALLRVLFYACAAFPVYFFVDKYFSLKDEVRNLKAEAGTARQQVIITSERSSR
jgi:hypothetical protein